MLRKTSTPAMQILLLAQKTAICFCALARIQGQYRWASIRLRALNRCVFSSCVSCMPRRLRGFVCVLKIVRKTAVQQRDVRVLHPLNPLKFLRNCTWSSFHYREFLKTKLKSIPSLSCIKGLNKSENVAMLTKSKLLLYNFMIV